MSKQRKRWLAGGTGLIVLAIILMGAIAAHVTGVAQSDAEAAARTRARCTTGGAPGMDVDTAQVAQQVKAVLADSTKDINVSGLLSPKEQVPNAKVIVATGIQMKIPARGQVIALATALQESTLRNLDHGDRDSIGLFQQRPSQGWGTRQQILDPVYASTKFYKALKSLKDWEHMPVTVAAQKVQKSGHPRAYAKHEPLATALQQAIAPTLGAPAAGPALAGGFGSAGCVTQAGTDYGNIAPGTLPDGYQIPINAPMQARNAIRWALGQLGTPYQWGGTCTNPHGNVARDRCDCSSLMQRAYGVAGVEISRTTYTQIHDGRPAPANALEPGDLVFSEGTASRPEHVSMFIGDGLVVHAPRPGRVVEVAVLGKVFIARRIVT
ncbi:NlpC/P60 family protein [Streptomyces sp. NPDC051219]|uniref:C40 family peptidase n=1 Tax=Streptomyces sp. NPDC051219 TaxID=3155283 RepID=UPI003421999F